MEVIRKLVLILTEYLHTIRVARLVSFGYTAVAIVLFSGFDSLVDLSSELILIIIYVGFFVYGGLYALNKYFDYEEDLKTSYKKGLSARSFLIKRELIPAIGITHILIGYIGVLIFLPKLYIITSLLIIVNLAYTVYLKKQNRVIAISTVALTGPLKSLLGIVFISPITTNVLLFLLVHYLYSVAIHAIKQGYKDRMEESLIVGIQYCVATIAVLLSIYGVVTFKHPAPALAGLFGITYVVLFNNRNVAKFFLR